jgi:pimeloyl-ACP methyl ester carboxylesterase
MSNLSPGTHSFTLRGTRQVYHVAGRGPVLVAHSGGPGVDYSYLRSSRLEELFTVVYPEPIGTGDSQPFPQSATYVDTYAEFLLALVDHLGVPSVHLLGHSHGGTVAQRFALDHPGRVAGLALYSSTPVTDAAFWAAAATEAAAYPQRNPGVPEAVEAAAVFGADTGRPDALNVVLPIYFADFWNRRAEFEPLRKAVRSWDVTFDTNAIDYRPELPGITAPTVVITGRHDFICGPVWAEMLHQGISGSRLVTLENSGHFGHIEEPEEFLDAVRRLLPAAFQDEVRATFRHGDTAGVVQIAAAELARARAAADPAGEVEALYALARVALRGDDLPRAEDLAAEALEVALRAGDRRLEERPRHVLAAVARLSGDLALARTRYLAGIALNEELGQPELVNAEYHNLAFTELHLGHLDRARDLFAEGRERVFRLGYRSFVPYLGVAAAALASADGDQAEAARMLGFTGSAFAALGQVPDPDDAAELARIRSAAVADLGEDAFASASAAGAGLDAVQAFHREWQA